MSEKTLKNVIKSFMNYFSEKDNTIDSNIASEEIARLFKQSVKSQLISDVPVGVLLSGGLDSRSILSAVTDHEENTDTFTIVFNEQNYSEGNIASIWSDIYKSNLHSIDFINFSFPIRNNAGIGVGFSPYIRSNYIFSHS